jgi:hypothetical protein
MEDLKTSISRILCLLVLLASFDVSLAETQLPARDNIEQEASSFRPDATATFDDNSSIIPPAVEAPVPVFRWTTASFCQLCLVTFQRYRLIAIRAPPHSSFIPA